MTIIYLNQRRKIPRNPVSVSLRTRSARSGSRMHPGWECFMAAWLSGIFTIISFLLSIQAMLNLISWGYAIGTGTFAVVFFILGGTIAEKLWERTID